MNTNTRPTTPPPPESDRLTELLALQQLEFLDKSEQAELELLRSQHPDYATEVQRSLADTLAEVMTAQAAPLDATLRSRLLQDADAFYSPQAGVGPRAATRTSAPTTSRWRWIDRAGWAVAACLAIAIAARLPGRSADENPEASRATLLATGAASPIPWTATASMPGAGGDVVWSDTLQRGYMRFVGLKPNDPAVSQYQLWVFDKDRPEATPVDGGVFDLKPGALAVIPIKPTLRVNQAILFAITEEKPGGVMVSDRTRLHLIAKPKG